MTASFWVAVAEPGPSGSHVCREKHPSCRQSETTVSRCSGHLGTVPRVRVLGTQTLATLCLYHPFLHRRFMASHFCSFYLLCNSSVLGLGDTQATRVGALWVPPLSCTVGGPSLLALCSTGVTWPGQLFQHPSVILRWDLIPALSVL